MNSMIHLHSMHDGTPDCPDDIGHKALMPYIMVGRPATPYAHVSESLSGILYRGNLLTAF